MTEFAECPICGATGLPERLAEHDCAPWVGADATIEVQLAEPDYQQLRDGFAAAVEHGYDEPFTVFVINHCSGDYRVTTV